MFQYSPILGRSSIWDLKYTFSEICMFFDTYTYGKSAKLFVFSYNKCMLIAQDCVKFWRHIAWQSFLVNSFADFLDVVWVKKIKISLSCWWHFELVRSIVPILFGAYISTVYMISNWQCSQCISQSLCVYISSAFYALRDEYYVKCLTLTLSRGWWGRS